MVRLSTFCQSHAYRPWTMAEIEKFRELAAGMELLIFELALGIGQRPGDLTNIRWSDYDGHTIRVVQGKTGVELWIPPTDGLKRILEEAKSVTQVECAPDVGHC